MFLLGNFHLEVELLQFDVQISLRDGVDESEVRSREGCLELYLQAFGGVVPLESAFEAGDGAFLLEADQFPLHLAVAVEFL
jgi:hypothetical protein